MNMIFCFFFFPHQMQDSHMNTTRTEVGRYCEISCKVRACSQSALFIIFLFDPYEKETKRNEKNCLIISLLLSDYLIVPLSQQADHYPLYPIIFNPEKKSMYTHSQTSSSQSPIPLLYSVPYIPCKSLNSTHSNVGNAALKIDKREYPPHTSPKLPGQGKRQAPSTIKTAL